MLILSANSAPSRWFQLEFAAAHVKRKAFVVSLYEKRPPPKDDLDNNGLLWAYVSATNYLQYDEVNFLDKVKKVLPVN